MHRADYMHCSKTFYIRDLSTCWFWYLFVVGRGLVLMPHRYQEMSLFQTFLWGCWGLGPFATSIKEMLKSPIAVAEVSVRWFNPVPYLMEVNINTEDVVRSSLGFIVWLCLLGYWSSKQWYARASLYWPTKSWLCTSLPNSTLVVCNHPWWEQDLVTYS